MDRVPNSLTAEELALAVLARRADGERLIEAALAQGDSRTASKLEKITAKFDKMIADYGLERFAEKGRYPHAHRT